jgi:15-cis-phytoene synthase
MDTADFLSELPVERRLALAYAPAGARTDTLALFALDGRLAGIVRQAREPLLAQMRLAWWRDRLGDSVQAAGLGDPLLERLSGWNRREGLVALVNGWESLLADPPLPDGAIDTFVRGRAEACADLARQLNLADAARPAASAAAGWALAELAGKLGDPAESARVRQLAQERDWAMIQLPRQLRAITVLYGLARRKQGAEALISGPRDMLRAARLGLLGR